jgi:hypothetical protein
MNKIHIKKFGLVLGLFVALVHLVWVLIIAAGWAQGLIDFIFRLHTLSNPFVVQALTLKHAVGLVVVTFVVAYVVGVVFAWIWNKFAVRA